MKNLLKAALGLFRSNSAEEEVVPQAEPQQEHVVPQETVQEVAPQTPAEQVEAALVQHMTIGLGMEAVTDGYLPEAIQGFGHSTAQSFVNAAHRKVFRKDNVTVILALEALTSSRLDAKEAVLENIVLETINFFVGDCPFEDELVLSLQAATEGWSTWGFVRPKYSHWGWGRYSCAQLSLLLDGVLKVEDHPWLEEGYANGRDMLVPAQELAEELLGPDSVMLLCMELYAVKWRSPEGDVAGLNTSTVGGYSTERFEKLIRHAEDMKDWPLPA